MMEINFFLFLVVIVIAYIGGWFNLYWLNKRRAKTEIQAPKAEDTTNRETDELFNRWYQYKQQFKKYKEQCFQESNRAMHLVYTSNHDNDTVSEIRERLITQKHDTYEIWCRCLTIHMLNIIEDAYIDRIPKTIHQGILETTIHILDAYDDSGFTAVEIYHSRGIYQKNLRRREEEDRIDFMTRFHADKKFNQHIIEHFGKEAYK